jgi:hypothetical protein
VVPSPVAIACSGDSVCVWFVAGPTVAGRLSPVAIACSGDSVCVWSVAGPTVAGPTVAGRLGVSATNVAGNRKPFFQLERTALNRNACLVPCEASRPAICWKNMINTFCFIARGELIETVLGRYSSSKKSDGLSAIRVKGVARFLSWVASPV